MSTGVTHFSPVDLWGQWFVGGQCQGCGPVGASLQTGRETDGGSFGLPCIESLLDMEAILVCISFLTTVQTFAASTRQT